MLEWKIINHKEKSHFNNFKRKLIQLQDHGSAAYYQWYRYKIFTDSDIGDAAPVTIKNNTT